MTIPSVISLGPVARQSRLIGASSGEKAGVPASGQQDSFAPQAAFSLFGMPQGHS
jgi:hypothetical protein